MAHAIAAATRTLAMTQLAELNRALDARRLVVGAGELGLATVPLVDGRTPGTLPDAAVLTRLCGEGSPVWPYIHGHFRTAAEEIPGFVPIHTEALRELSHRAGLHHAWGL